MWKEGGILSKYFDLLSDIYQSILINNYERVYLAAILFQLIAHMVPCGVTGLPSGASPGGG